MKKEVELPLHIAKSVFYESFLNFEKIEDYKKDVDEIDWDYTNEYRRLSEDFIKEYKHKLN